MMKKIFTDKKIIMTMLSIILVLSIMTSTTYSLFFKVNTLENTEAYTAGVLEITVDKGEVLTLADILPMTDEEGSTLEPYTFTITNNGNLTYTFDLKMLSTTASNPINFNYVKIKINDEDPITFGTLVEGLIKEDMTLNPSDSLTLSVRIWLDENTPNTEIGKNFAAKITTDGIGDIYEPTVVEYLTTLYNKGTASQEETANSVTYEYRKDVSMMTDIGGNLRYYGADPDNYVMFNGEQWRIIGVFNNIDDGTGNKETRVKIARANPLDTTYAWNSDGTNDWTNASLKTYLNGEYLTSITTSNLIEDAIWDIRGSSTYSGLYANDYYNLERTTGTAPSSTTAVTWTGEIALMYPSDYMYAGDLMSCQKDGYNWRTDQTNCGDKSWLMDTSTQWTLMNVGNSTGVYRVCGNGSVCIGSYVSGTDTAVTPVLYLNSNVVIVDGSGKPGDEFILS